MTLTKPAAFLPNVPGKTGWPWEYSGTHQERRAPDRSWPTLSVVIPSLNQGQYLEETIRSVLMQNYPALELIIMDGGSTDNSLEVIEKYANWITYWISEPDDGQSHAVNKGILKASGEILLWLNADDLCLPESFFTAVDVFLEYPSSRMVVGQAWLINNESKRVGELKSAFDSFEQVIATPVNRIRQVSTFFRRSLFDEMGYIDESLHIAMDTELLLRFTSKYQPVVIDAYLTAFRIHREAKSFRQIITGYKESDQVRENYFSSRWVASQYHKNSATNWLLLSLNDRFSLMDRIHCVWNAIRHQPDIIFQRRFAGVLKRLLLNG